MPFFIAFFVSLCVFFVNSSAHATDFGLAMHGTPKYQAGAPHLDYANPNAPKGGDLTMSAIGTFDNLNPYAIKGKPAAGLDELFYERLMIRVWDEPFTLYPMIAQSGVMSEDRSSLSITLDPAARWHDGTPITAEDVLFSFETLKNHGRPNMRRVYQLVERVERPAPNTIIFHFGAGRNQETPMILAMMPVLSKACWAERDFNATLLEPPISSGPYKITATEPGRKITYTRDPDYWGAAKLARVGHNNFDHVRYDYYRDESVAFEAFKAGEIDLWREYDAGRWQTGYDIPAVASGGINRAALPHGRPERVRGFIFNTRRAPFDEPQVREALSLLFDFNWMNKTLFHGAYQRINSIFPNTALAAQPPYAPPLFTTPRDKRMAMRQADTLLKSAGWLVENGQRMKDGKPLRFNILLSQPEEEKIALNFKRDLEKMGINVTIRVLDSAAYRTRLNEYGFDMTLYYWMNSLSPGTEQHLYWSCEAANQPARWNFAGICDAQVDALTVKIAEAKSREDLVEAARALDHIIMHGHYMIPLYYAGADRLAWQKGLQHPAPPPLYGTVLETWWGEKN